LESLLWANRHVETKWIASVGTFGVTGESVRLAEIVGLARKHGARIYLDDAHLIGVTGAQKRGLAESLNLLNDVDLVMGSFQMAFGNVGAFVAGPAKLIDQLRVRARPYIFSYTLPAANAAALLETLSILKGNEGDRLVERLWKNVARLRQGLTAHGFSIISQDSQITSTRIGDEQCTADFVESLAADGVWVQMYLHPSVPKGKGVVRLTCMATHSESHIDRVIETMREHRPPQLR
jgi:8-amino-7-oxononanoate synthase